MKRTLIVLLVITYSTPSSAGWFCKESASKAMGNTFYACGHSLEKSLTLSREKSLLAAKREFESFCNDSSNCKDKAFTMSPLRTDCHKEGGGYSCHRGLEYTILDQKNDSTDIDRNSLDSKIASKEMELAKLQEDAAQYRRLERIERNIQSMKSKHPPSSKEDYLKADLPNLAQSIPTQGIALKFVATGVPLKDGDSKDSEQTSLGGLGAEYDINLWRALSARMSLTWVFGSSEIKSKDRGVANSTSEKEYHSHSGADGNFALPITFNNFTFSPLIGYLAVSYKSTQFTYNDYGIGLIKTDNKHSYNSAYTGLGMRFGKNYFLDIEPRHYLKDNKSSLAVSFGARFEF